MQKFTRTEAHKTQCNGKIKKAAPTADKQTIKVSSGSPSEPLLPPILTRQHEKETVVTTQDQGLSLYVGHGKKKIKRKSSKPLHKGNTRFWHLERASEGKHTPTRAFFVGDMLTFLKRSATKSSGSLRLP
jgi:hypothetical protein